MSKVLVTLVLFAYALLFMFGCGPKNLVLDPIEIQDDVLTIGGCAISTGGCVVANCGEYIAACAAEKCDPIALSICLIGQCGEETRDCIEQITKIIGNTN